jgi:hypothetical protein
MRALAPAKPSFATGLIHTFFRSLFIPLGNPKNLVDSEVMMGLLNLPANPEFILEAAPCRQSTLMEFTGNHCR